MTNGPSGEAAEAIRITDVEMAGIEPASVGESPGLLRAQFVKSFLGPGPRTNT